LKLVNREGVDLALVGPPECDASDYVLRSAGELAYPWSTGADQL